MSDSDTFRSAFDLISDDTRVAILEALAEHKLTNPDDPSVSFSELRRRIGNPDSGNFNYHLDLLRQRFIEKTESGYQLTTAGGHVVGDLINGKFDDDLEVQPIGLGYDCPFCEAEMMIKYAGGEAIVECKNEEIFLRDRLPPQIVRKRSPDGVARVLNMKATLSVISLTNNICEVCHNSVEANLNTNASGPIEIVVSCTCTECGNRRNYNPLLAAITVPESMSFFTSHGFNLLQDPVWEIGVLADVVMVLSDESPLELTVKITIEDEQLRFVLDESAALIEIERRMIE